MKTLKGPTTLGNYVLLEKVGGGLSSTVFKGQATNNPTRVVAIKVIDRQELLKVSAHAEDYIQREIAIMRQLDHPNIVKLLEVLDDGHTISLVMEFCQGGSLREYLDKKGKLPEPQVFVFLSQLVDALKYMYSKSIIHRDLKPHNILLTADGTLKICDYGFARIYEKQKLMNSILGSPLYMAPEILGSNKYTAKCDLWSLGVIVHEMLAGSVPFYTNSVVQLFSYYAKETGLKLPPVIQKSVSNACNSLVESLLMVRPEDRITWPDFFQHPFFLSVVPGTSSTPASPVLSRTETNDGALCVLAVPRCERVDLNVSELDDHCLTVRLFKLSLATKLQLDVSSISASSSPILVMCTSSGVTEMEDDKPLSVYSNIFARDKNDKPRILYIDIANLHDYAGEALCDTSSIHKEEVESVGNQDTSEVGRLVKDFKQFVLRQDFFHKTTDERFGQCVRYLAERDILLSTVKKAILLLESNLKSLTILSGASLELYNHQQNIIEKKSLRFAAHLQDMRSVTLHASLKADGRVSLLDLAGGETALLSLMEQTTTEGERLGALVKAIKTATARAELEIQTPLLCEETLKNLKSTQREAQQWVEGLRLYRDHTAKWASVVSQHKAERENESNNDDVGDLEWSFVVDGLLEVRAGCAHDLDVAEKLTTRVQAYQQKCISTSASMWEELSSRLKAAVETREALQQEIHALGSLGKQILDQQARVDMLEAIFYLPKLYQAYLHTTYGRFTFENRAIDMLNTFSMLRERQVVKLASFQDFLKGSPFEHLFKRGVDLSVSALPSLQPTIPLVYHDVPATESIDDEFSVVVPEEDVMTFVRENAILAAEVKQLKDEKQTQDITIPVVQMLGLSAETDTLRKELEDAKLSSSKQSNEFSELHAKYNELVNTLKDRENEKSRERDEFSSKYAHSIEMLRSQNKTQQSQYEARIQALEKELEETKKAAVFANQENKVRPPIQDRTKADQREREQEETVNALYTALTEKNEALASLQTALDVSEAERAEQSARIEILLKLIDKQE